MAIGTGRANDGAGHLNAIDHRGAGGTCCATLRAGASVRAVSTTLLTGVVAAIVMAPTGALGQTPVWARVGALLAGIAAYAITKRSVLASVLVTVAFVVVWALVLFG